MIISNNLDLAALATFLPLLGSTNLCQIRVPHGQFGGYAYMNRFWKVYDITEYL